MSVPRLRNLARLAPVLDIAVELASPFCSNPGYSLLLRLRAFGTLR